MKLFSALSLFASIALVSTGRAEAPDPLAEAWKQASEFLFNDANASFVKAKGAPGISDRERKFGEAATLLNTQPRTQSNLHSVERLLEGLIQENNSDNVGILSRFLLGRYWQMHAQEQNEAKARDIYLKLVEAQTGNPVAELGAAQIALMDLYTANSVEESNQRAQALMALEPHLKTSIGRREFHMNAGFALAETGGDSKLALAHLLAADKENITRWQDQSAAWILIADLAEQNGDKQLAKTYCRQFIEKFKRDNRYFTIQERLQKLESGS